MTCPSSARLAAAASGADPVVADHAASCASCTARLARERETSALVASVAEVRLDSGRRAAMRAHVLAASDATPVADRRGGSARRRVAAAVSIAAAAAAVAVAVAVAMVRGGAGTTTTDPVVQKRASASVAKAPVPAAAAEPVAKAPAPAAVAGSAAKAHAPAPRPSPVSGAVIESGTAQFERDGDVVRIADGALTLDARGRRPTEVLAGETRVTLANAQAHVAVRAGRVLQVKVLAGAAKVTVARETWVVEVGETWQPPAAPADVDAFRIGWEALRAGRNPEALAAFDRASDPRVREDASYWAAVAAARAGDVPDARRRLRDFLAAFPASPHAAEARAALER